MDASGRVSVKALSLLQLRRNTRKAKPLSYLISLFLRIGGRLRAVEAHFLVARDADECRGQRRVVAELGQTHLTLFGSDPGCGGGRRRGRRWRGGQREFGRLVLGGTFAAEN